MMTIELRAVTPGQVVHRELGLAGASKACDIDESTVWRWTQDRPKGTGGVVPSRYHLILMRWAHQLGKSLSADDLVFGRHE